MSAGYRRNEAGFPGGSRYMRSVSRQGCRDLGVNAAPVRASIAVLKAVAVR
jgi:hypothetical protein